MGTVTTLIIDIIKNLALDIIEPLHPGLKTPAAIRLNMMWVQTAVDVAITFFVLGK